MLTLSLRPVDVPSPRVLSPDVPSMRFASSRGGWLRVSIPSEFPKMRDFKVRLTSKNEGLCYLDAEGIYRFDCHLDGNRWIVSLPPSKGERYERHPLSPEEQRRIIPRIKTFLARVWWFGVWPVRYEVTFLDQAGPTN